MQRKEGWLRHQPTKINSTGNGLPPHPSLLTQAGEGTEWSKPRTWVTQVVTPTVIKQDMNDRALQFFFTKTSFLLLIWYYLLFCFKIYSHNIDKTPFGHPVDNIIQITF